MNLIWWTDFDYLQGDKSLKIHFAKKSFVPIPTIIFFPRYARTIQQIKLYFGSRPRKFISHPLEPRKAGKSKSMERKEWLPFTNSM